MALIYKEVSITKHELEGFKCSRCKQEHRADDWVEMQEYLHWRNTGGYGSRWGDGCTVEITLCQKCQVELFADFVEYPNE